MQCPSCYDEEIHGTGFNRVVKKTYLEMEEVCWEGGYMYHQCPRCTKTRKRSGLFSPGLIESASPEEVRDVALRKSQSGSGIKKAVVASAIGIGAVLLIGAIASSSKDSED